MKAFDFAVAETIDGAMGALADGWRPKAGGIDLVDRLKERTEESEKIVSILCVAECATGVAANGDALQIGALTTLREIAENADVQKRAGALAQACGSAATPQLRAVATLGGNLCQRPRCWYFRQEAFPCLKKGGGTCYAVDGENHFHALFGGGPCHIVHPSNAAPPLVAMGATLQIRKGAETRSVNAADFFVLPSKNLMAENILGPDELITGVTIPHAVEKSAWVDVKQRQSYDWPLAACAVARVGGKWNVILAGVAPIPWRAKKAEEVLAGADAISDELAERAAEAALDGAAPMAHNAWRLAIVRAAVRRALLKAEGRSEEEL